MWMLLWRWRHHAVLLRWSPLGRAMFEVGEAKPEEGRVVQRSCERVPEELVRSAHQHSLAIAEELEYGGSHRVGG